MDIRKIKKLIELLEESGIEELEIQEGEESVRISRGTRQAAAPAPQYPPQYMAAPAQAAAPAPAAPAQGGGDVLAALPAPGHITRVPDSPRRRRPMAPQPPTRMRRPHRQ